jgi:hypothetical protein
MQIKCIDHMNLNDTCLKISSSSTWSSSPGDLREGHVDEPNTIHNAYDLVRSCSATRWPVKRWFDAQTETDSLQQARCLGPPRPQCLFGEGPSKIFAVLIKCVFAVTLALEACIPFLGTHLLSKPFSSGSLRFIHLISWYSRPVYILNI